MTRIQRKRVKGWKMPENAIYIGRGSRWGNPFTVEDFGLEAAINNYRECLLNNALAYYYFDEIQATTQFKRFEWMSSHLEELKGHDLACWCKEGDTCHGDVLIELINENHV